VHILCLRLKVAVGSYEWAYTYTQFKFALVEFDTRKNGYKSEILIKTVDGEYGNKTKRDFLKTGPLGNLRVAKV